MNIVARSLCLALLGVLLFPLGLEGAARKEALANRDAGQAYLEKNQAREGVVTTRTGLQYEILREGPAKRLPTGKDLIKIHYHGTLIDGTVVDSSRMRGEPIEVTFWNVIAGWAEGLKLMSPGDHYKFFIPYKLAYGAKDHGSIPGYSTLVFEIELLELRDRREARKKKK